MLNFLSLKPMISSQGVGLFDVPPVYEDRGQEIFFNPVLSTLKLVI